jgi:hypothetical protein
MSYSSDIRTVDWILSLLPVRQGKIIAFVYFQLYYVSYVTFLLFYSTMYRPKPCVFCREDRLDLQSHLL